jgi:hypothetical protein
VKNPKQRYTIAIAFCLTLGLAPFFPEPHLWGKVKWILGGAEGMAAMDWFDFAMHGSPFVYLIFLMVADLRSRTAMPKDNKKSV